MKKAVDMDVEMIQAVAHNPRRMKPEAFEALRHSTVAMDLPYPVRYRARTTRRRPRRPLSKRNGRS